MPAPFDRGEEPEPASFAPVLFPVPERLPPPVVGPLPAAPGEAPEPASFGPVLLAVPERLVPDAPDPPSAARTAGGRRSKAVRARAGYPSTVGQLAA